LVRGELKRADAPKSSIGACAANLSHFAGKPFGFALITVEVIVVCLHNAPAL
jgi:hypothetical protein